MARNSHPSHQSQSRIIQESHVYLLCNLPFLFMCKWGISDKPNTRTAQVDKSTIGAVRKVASTQIPFAWQAEGFVRLLYCWTNVNNIAPWLLKNASGRTEWHLNINVIIGGIVYFYGQKLGAELDYRFYLAFFFSPVVWLDGLLWILVFKAISWVFAFLLLYGAYWFFTNA